MPENPNTNEVAGWALGAAGAGVAGAVGVALAVPKYGTTLAFVILLLVVVLVGGYLAWQKLKRMRASARFLSNLKQESSSAPREIKDPNRQAELDKLRKRFLEGIEVYRSRGKEVYSVPWFLIIGESGSGKTEAIRHSNLDFPQGLNDLMQGTGGTINMDWWFTNHGVILDTAGSMVFPEMGQDTSPRWQEFLKLLKKHRSHCPINGLVLVLAVDSLIRDSAATIAQKAGRIARQLDLIQRELDVRFPVSVLVTKCDKLTGFREFFDHIDDPELQDQMVGWSNPDPLDAPFQPRRVSEHLEQVLQRLRRRRLGLLRDPLPAHGPKARRTDEVDALYALPKSLSLIAPRLSRYLETIFVAGAFSAKPVFLRGIYFTSAMQVGTDLDEAVWNALGRPPETGDNGKGQQEVGRPFFLRHVFLKKVFLESGLVTRATNTLTMLRQRKLALMGVTSACLVLLMLFAWAGYRRLKNEIGKQRDDWIAAKGDWTKNDQWHPVVSRVGDGSWVYQYQGESNTVRDISLAGFHERLRKHADTPLDISWVFLPVQWLKDVSRRDLQGAQRVVFEGSVIWPLIQETRAKMSRTPAPSEPVDPFHADALEALIKLEADLARTDRVVGATNGGVALTNYLRPYLGYLMATNAEPTNSNVLGEVFCRTYTSRNPWPTKYLSGGNTLASNTALRLGLDRFLTHAKQANTTHAAQLGGLKLIRDRAIEFERQETNWHRAAVNNDNIPPDWVEKLTQAKTNLDEALKSAGTNGLLLQGTNTLAGHQQLIRQESVRSGSEAVRRVQMAMGSITNQLFEEIRQQLDRFRTTLAGSAEIPSVSSNDLAGADRGFLQYLDPPRNSIRAYEFRFRSYTQAWHFSTSHRLEIANEIGRRWWFLGSLRNDAELLRTNREAGYSNTNEYFGPLHNTCDFLIKERRAQLGTNFVTQYRQEVANALEGLKTGGVDMAYLSKAAWYLTNVMSDLDDLEFQKQVEPHHQPALQGLRPRLENVRTDLITRFAEQSTSQLRSGMGFPVFRDLPPTGGVRELGMPDLAQLNQFALKLGKDLDDPVIKSFPDAPLQSLRTKLGQARRMLHVLVDTHGVGRKYSMSIPKTRENESVTAEYTALRIPESGDLDRRIAELPVELGRFQVEQPLTFQSKWHANNRENPNQPVARTTAIGNWAALRMIADPAYASELHPQKSDHKVWRVRVPVNEANREEKRLLIEVEFDEPLPREDWPSVKDW